jgi:hypothetical protein
MPTFDDATIERLFGAEDAENETESRFKEYFYYNAAYSSLTAELPIRILVGHKGVGKSALLKRAYIDDVEHSNLSVWRRPDDLTPVRQEARGDADFNTRIEHWKTGILKIVAAKVVEALVGDHVPFGAISELTNPPQNLRHATNDFLTGNELR